MSVPSLIGSFASKEPSFSDKSDLIIYFAIAFVIYSLIKFLFVSPYFVWSETACELEKSISGMSRKDEFIECVLKMQTTYHYEGSSYDGHAERAFQLLAITEDPQETEKRLRKFIDIVKDDADFQRTHIAAKSLIEWIRNSMT